jgi:hypothetical protein
MIFRMPDSYYDPPESPDPCCHEGDPEDRDYNPEHDVQACMDAQAEDAAEARAERQREDMMFFRDENEWM